jgi:glycine/D-amino acid oxidase-like deaminating enzyme
MPSRNQHVDFPAPGGRRAWWLREALAADPGDVCPPLDHRIEADVVVLGGGYTGMWTALFLTEEQPGIRVAVLERDICGGGASGRNGGFLTGWWDELPELIEMFGEQAALAACRALGGSIRSIGEWCVEHGVDAWYTPGGYLDVAASPGQDGAWRSAVAEAARLGVADEYVELTRDEVRRRCDSPVYRGGVFMRAGATVQPARLARGLRRVLLDRGVSIFEGTPVRRFRAGPPAEAETLRGTVRAGQAVIAMNAWATGFRSIRPRIVAFGSYIVLTAPAPDLLEELGWTGGECITDSRSALHYYRTTNDGRIAFGGGGGRAALGSRVGDRFTHDVESARRAAAGLRRTFPSFDRVPIEDAWGGPIDMSPSHMPFFGTWPSGNVHFGVGYSGNGVAPSHLGGHVLAGLVAGREDEWTTLPMVGHLPAPFPPEPLRTAGGFLVREAIVKLDDAADEGRKAPPLAGLVARTPRMLGYHWGPRSSDPRVAGEAAIRRPASR